MPSCKAFHILLDELLTEQYMKVYYFDTDYFRQTLDNYEELENILLEYNIDQVPSLLNKYTGEVMYLDTFNENNDVDVVKMEVDAFISKTVLTAKYIPQYTVLICVYILSLIIFMFIYIKITDISHENTLFIISASCFILIILSFFLKKSISNTMNYKGYALHVNMVMLIWYTYLISLLSLVKFFFIEKKLKQGK